MMGLLMQGDSLLDLNGVGFLMAAVMLLFGIGLKDDVIGVSANHPHVRHHAGVYD